VDIMTRCCVAVFQTMKNDAQGERKGSVCMMVLGTRGERAMSPHRWNQPAVLERFPFF
jgi:hypothetical protein